VATPCEPHDDAKQGTLSETVAGDPTGSGRGIEEPWVRMVLSHEQRTEHMQREKGNKQNPERRMEHRKTVKQQQNGRQRAELTEGSIEHQRA